MLAAAFARPYLAGSAAATTRVLVIALDRSFSMDAPGRFAEALEPRACGYRRRESGRANRCRCVRRSGRGRRRARPGGCGTCRARPHPADVWGHPIHCAFREGVGPGRRGRRAPRRHHRPAAVPAGTDRHQPVLAQGLQIEVVDVGPPAANLARDVAAGRARPRRRDDSKHRHRNRAAGNFDWKPTAGLPGPQSTRLTVSPSPRCRFPFARLKAQPSRRRLTIPGPCCRQSPVCDRGCGPRSRYS